MISIAYCKNCNPTKIISAGNITSPVYYNGEAGEQPVLNDIEEPNYDNIPDFKTKDGTVINNSDEWLSYLAKYIPQ